MVEYTRIYARILVDALVLKWGQIKTRKITIYLNLFTQFLVLTLLTLDTFAPNNSTKCVSALIL